MRCMIQAIFLMAVLNNVSQFDVNLITHKDRNRLRKKRANTTKKL